MTAEIEQVTRLQILDRRIAELQREVAALPKHIAEIERALDSHLRRLEADRAALTANQKDRKSLEEDIKLQEQKMSKFRDQMAQAKTNEQYRAFQHEIDFAAREIRKSEDRILDLMSESEPLDANVKKAEVALKEEKQHVEAEKKRVLAHTAALQAQLQQLDVERKEAAARVSPQLYKDYQRIRKKWHGGSAVADATEGRCSACNIVLRPQFFQDLRRGDTLMFCESCGRMLYYNPPINVEQDLATRA
jgi:predicted  nucleic acid-binding Zn-ribbon protein